MGTVWTSVPSRTRTVYHRASPVSRLERPDRLGHSTVNYDSRCVLVYSPPYYDLFDGVARRRPYRTRAAVVPAVQAGPGSVPRSSKSQLD